MSRQPHEGHHVIHGYHVIMPMYGFWLPNDPRGSWSESVRKWELVRFGKATKSLERAALSELSDSERHQREAAKQALECPAVSIDGHQAAAIAQSFADMASKCNYTFWACAILPEHTHLVIARHTYKVEQIVNLLKGASTSHLVEMHLHPLADYAKSGMCPPRMWAAHRLRQNTVAFG